MASYYEVVNHILKDGRISGEELTTLSEHIYRKGAPELADVKLLVELYTSAKSWPAAFENFFYGVLKKVILADGEIQPGEQFYLLKVLYSDRIIRPRELEFLRELRREAKSVTPEFETLCQNAFQAPATNWDSGGVLGTSA